MQNRVEFLGHVIYRDTIMPSETKVAAIRMCPTPCSKTELRTFLGSVNYLSKFIPELQAKCADLYQLCGKNNIWMWTAEPDQAFEVVEEAMLDARVLKSFNIVAEVNIASDASESGLYAVMFQKAANGKMMPVVFASRILKDYEKNYAQIEKEALSIINAVRKFHQYIYGQKFMLWNDHRPLKYIFGQGRNLSKYNYDILYIRGTENVLADILSRFAIKEYQVGSSGEEFLSLIQDAALTELQLTREQIRNESLMDPELSKYDAIWRVPHTGHPGINTMKELARRYCWCISIETDIEHTVGICQLCQSRRNATPEVPLHQWDVPMQPWERLHVDFAGLVACRLFILVFDAYSYWPEIEEIINASASEANKKLKSMLSRI
ncbi:hypothetical protein GJ496_008413 [Pomphorhynchus laevis]|nr:hypothetical protein GJ496_008413 [Pomphorhynchus laevis]